MTRYLLAVCLVLAGCAGDATPVDTRDAVDVFEVGKLFTVDGCTIYRFNDAGRYHYFTDCRGSVSSAQTSSCGKSCVSHWDEENRTETP